jgi:hypothetical protein
MTFVHDDGGRAEAGYKGEAGDCAVRAVAIATGLPYQDVYATLNNIAKRERPRGGRRRSNAREGVYSQTLRWLMDELGWEWVPTMGIGTGCTVHLHPDELPEGRLVVRVSKHYTAVIDGVIHDTYDPSRDGARCVYGYFRERRDSK